MRNEMIVSESSTSKQPLIRYFLCVRDFDLLIVILKYSNLATFSRIFFFLTFYML